MSGRRPGPCRRRRSRSPRRPPSTRQRTSVVPALRVRSSTTRCLASTSTRVGYSQQYSPPLVGSIGFVPSRTASASPNWSATSCASSRTTCSDAGRCTPTTARRPRACCRPPPVVVPQPLLPATPRLHLPRHEQLHRQLPGLALVGCALAVGLHLPAEDHRRRGLGCLLTHQRHVLGLIGLHCLCALAEPVDKLRLLVLVDAERGIADVDARARQAPPAHDQLGRLHRLLDVAAPEPVPLTQSGLTRYTNQQLRSFTGSWNLRLPMSSPTVRPSCATYRRSRCS